MLRTIIYYFSLLKSCCCLHTKKKEQEKLAQKKEEKNPREEIESYDQLRPFLILKEDEKVFSSNTTTGKEGERGKGGKKRNETFSSRETSCI